MFNENVLNSIPLNSGVAPSDITQDVIVFDGFGLCNSIFASQTNDYRNVADIDLQTYIAPNIDGGGVLGKFYQEKDINFKIAIKASSKAELNEKIDELKYRTSKTEGLLEITIDGVTRMLKATVTSLTFPRIKYNDTTIGDIDIVFKTLEPNFYLKNNVGLLYENITSDTNEEITNNGTAKTSPKFYFLFKTGIATLTSTAITVGGFTITVSETISDNDVLIIDGEGKEVTLNGTVVDYDGLFPELGVGSNPINFVFSGAATYDVDISTIYKQKYL